MPQRRTHRRTRTAVTISLLIAGSITTSTATANGNAQTDGDGVIATFEGRPLNLAEDWGEATACYSDTAGTRCYRTEHELRTTELNREAATARATCSTSLRLYRSTGFGGSSLWLNQRFTPISLSSYGFNNATSSYRVGACSTTFYDQGQGSTVYPGNTSAGASATSMLSGWNNRVSTVYIS